MARVLLLFGGRSAEHEISCVSAVAVANALTAAGHLVIPVGIDRKGGWHIADPSRNPFEADGRSVTLKVPDGTLHSGSDELEFEVVFPVLHGPYGEDGTVQGLFDMIDIPYVGCGVMASAVAMDKDVTKRLLHDAGVPVVPWQVVRSHEHRRDVAASIGAIETRFDYPMFVKPARLGSSIGVSKVEDGSGMRSALELAFSFDDKVVVEPAIRGREVEVAVLEGAEPGDPPRVSVPGEIVIDTEWYDYSSKYEDETSRFVAPAPVGAAVAEELRQRAAEAFVAIEGRGLARIDFFVPSDGRGVLLNEVNTMPGFTPISGFPKMWQASGLSYPELCNELVRLALR